MDPDHEECCAPVVIVLHGVLGLRVHIAERDPPRFFVSSLKGAANLRVMCDTDCIIVLYVPSYCAAATAKELSSGAKHSWWLQIKQKLHQGCSEDQVAKDPLARHRSRSSSRAISTQADSF